MIECHMKSETYAQPQLLRENAKNWADLCQQVCSSVAERPQAVLIGRGSSGNACTFASYLFALRSGRQPIEFRPWMSTQSVPKASWRDCVAYAYSASGQSTDIAKAASWLQDRGARVMAITVTPDQESNLGRACDVMLAIDVGVEVAVPATKSFTAQLIATAGVCGYDVETGVRAISDSMDRVLASDYAEQLGSFMLEGQNVAFVARGPALAAAQDAALKLQEAVGLHCTAWSAAEILHGPIRAFGPKDRIVLFRDALDGPTDSLDAVSTSLLAKGVPHMLVAPDTLADDKERPHALGPMALQLPMPPVRWAGTLVLTFLAQLSTLWVAERLGVNPDLPPGLNKVTYT